MLYSVALSENIKSEFLSVTTRLISKHIKILLELSLDILHYFTFKKLTCHNQYGANSSKIALSPNWSRKIVCIKYGHNFCLKSLTARSLNLERNLLVQTSTIKIAQKKVRLSRFCSFISFLISDLAKVRNYCLHCQTIVRHNEVGPVSCVCFVANGK